MNKYKWVNWVEPLGDGSYGAIECRALITDVIKYMKEQYQEQFKNHPNYPYKSDDKALEDFITIHMAWKTIE